MKLTFSEISAITRGLRNQIEQKNKMIASFNRIGDEELVEIYENEIKSLTKLIVKIERGL